MSRLAIALVAYGLLGALAFATLNDFRIRTLTLLILGMFAVKSWIRRKDVLRDQALDDDLMNEVVLHPEVEGESE